MLTLSQTVGYAIRALSCLDSSADDRRTARELSACTGIPPSYLSKILRALVKAGLIHSQRGHYGGFYLNQPARATSLAKVIAAIDPKLRVAPCLLGLPLCEEDDEPCPLHRFWQTERARIERKLERTSLADIASFYRRQMPESCGDGPAGGRATRCRPTERQGKRT